MKSKLKPAKPEKLPGAVVDIFQRIKSPSHGQKSFLRERSRSPLADEDTVIN